MSTLIHNPQSAGPGGNRQAAINSNYRTSCSICRLGIFAGQQVVWTRGQHLGFSHTECVEALPVCIWCDNTFPPDPQHPQSQICAGCAAKEQFPDKGARR